MHAGSSTAALDVLASVTSEYLQNVGRTIRFLCDKYSHTMTAEVGLRDICPYDVAHFSLCHQEIILHTLFEGGTTKIQDLERYIKDDVVRYGGRLGDLEKKLVGAYRDVVSVVCAFVVAYVLLTVYLRLLWTFRMTRPYLKMLMPIRLRRAFPFHSIL